MSADRSHHHSGEGAARVYLDHAATTPMVPAAEAALADASALVGNPSSLHRSGRRVRALVEESREQIAAALGAHPTEVVFTSGGTEADNLAVTGGYAARTSADPLARGVVTSTIEHHAVLEPAEALERVGADLRLVSPEPSGTVAVEAVRDALQRIEAGGARVALVSLMWANNEIGTVQPVPEVATLARARGATVHSDAVQAAGPLEVSFAESGLDLMSVSAHKLGGPAGVGVLLARREVPLQPLVRGGGHERGLRSGTLPAALIAACAAAVSEAVARRAEETPRLVALRDRLFSGVLGLNLGMGAGGRWTPGSAVDRLPGNVHLVVPGCEPDSLLFLLDAAGIEASTGSACQAGVPGRSHVLDAIGVRGDGPVGVVRLTLGRTTTEADVDRAVAALADCVPRARAAASVDAGVPA
ncbi:aminotransferase class V-fold PLP-dependent enzyme [Nostocoides sp. F2B08]|uniref:cysteine desulfurase family protein n=1 Tax=Nostocoides sp. F2B08 TaxID=2653936 RepID=UPI0012638376|nr:cysteine desulfurase family protein [Tetrasphaera sp. F2B08]KAB7746118.1 aminotransferase class V-fold PLP-dependent enzyme [Tetrasphaera sp. F2B08]